MASPTSVLLVVCAALLIQCAGMASSRKIYASGSGLGMLSMPETVKEIITLSGKATPNVLYLGTATYDAEDAMHTQTKGFADVGCKVDTLELAVGAPSMEKMRAQFAHADVVLVSGGNTLFARDRWVTVGVDTLMHEALANGTVLCGGSAGAIVWFDGGHSDSMEPSSYKNPPGPLLNPNKSDAVMTSWAYIRVPGLAILPSLFCPHYDMTGSNGVLRSVDFTDMLRHHTGENGLGIDNWSAVVVDGDKYTIISRAGKPGSVLPDGTFTPNRDGRPGAWRLNIDPSTGDLIRKLVPTTGTVDSLLLPARYISESSMLKVARAQNPDDGKPPSPA